MPFDAEKLICRASVYGMLDLVLKLRSPDVYVRAIRYWRDPMWIFRDGLRILDASISTTSRLVLKMRYIDILVRKYFWYDMRLYVAGIVSMRISSICSWVSTRWSYLDSVLRRDEVLSKVYSPAHLCDLWYHTTVTSEEAGDSRSLIRWICLEDILAYIERHNDNGSP